MSGQQFVDAPPLNAPNLVAKPVTPVVPETPKAPETPKQEKIETPQVNSSDILKRTQDKSPEKPDANKESNYREDLDKITDPSVKAIAEKAVKDFESGYNQKYQDLAAQRKELDKKLQQISTWTPQRLAEELRKPEFVQAMQILQSQAPPSNFEGNADEWSGLNESEKSRILASERETQSLRSQMNRMLQSQEDIETKKAYPDFDPVVVDDAIRGLSDGSITASRADIWKVVNHDKNVEKGYQFGYEDGYRKAQEKLNGSTVLNGNLNVTNADEVPDDVKKGGFSSIAMWRLARSKNGAKK